MRTEEFGVKSVRPQQIFAEQGRLQLVADPQCEAVHRKPAQHVHQIGKQHERDECDALGPQRLRHVISDIGTNGSTSTHFDNGIVLHIFVKAFLL